MDKKTIIDYIESSFIKDILLTEDLTDITYNGKDIYYQTNKHGRKKSEIEITNNEVKDFLRQIANLSEKQFSYLNPVLDLNIGKYRLNAVNNSVGRVYEDAVVTFSFRIASITPKISNDHKFMDEDVEKLLDSLIHNHISIVIAGLPGVGKTELQKYLISRVQDNERIIIIDETVELAYLSHSEHLDITIWQADNSNEEASVSNLIKNGLRSSPDWMIISEARGEEMYDILNSTLTGVPIITTIHSLDAFTASNRMAKMVMMNEKRMDYNDVLSNIYEHFKIIIYLKKIVDKDKHIKRYISSIVEIDDSGVKNEIYKEVNKSKIYKKISKKLLNLLSIDIETIKHTRFMKHE